MLRFLPSEVKEIISNLPLKLKKELIKEEKRLDVFTWKQKSSSRINLID